LKHLKKNTFSHLWNAYGVSVEKDKINLFFHFPVATKTATLHLHIWVNKGDHPLNQSREFQLDDVIQHLENSRPINALILSRNEGRFTIPTGDRLHLIEGMPENQPPSKVDRAKFKLPID
jgi:hypothetical protein